MITLSDFHQKSYLKSAEVARLFNVDHSTVFLWVKKGKLRPLRTPGRNFRFSHEEVRKILDERSNKKTNQRNTPRFKVEYPVIIKTSLQSEHSYDALITGISSHGLSLSVSDNGTFLRQLEKNEVTSLLVFNKQHTLLKDTIEGTICHFNKIDNEKISIGLETTV